jgi:RND family efflux transporter MFP subunit
MAFIKKTIERLTALKNFSLNLTKKQKIAALVVLLGLFVIALLAGDPVTTEAPINETRKVELINVGLSSTESSPLSLTGTIRSESEAVLKTESQGEVTGVYKKVGDFVYAGEIIAELRNTSERAAVLQAQALLEAARANLQKGTSGVRSEDKAVLQISLDNAINSFSSAKTNTKNVLRSSYSAVESAVIQSMDLIFSNPKSANPTLIVSTSESGVANQLSQSRVTAQSMILREKAASTNLDGETDLISELNETEKEVLFVRDMIDNSIVVINNAIPSATVPLESISAYKAALNGARATISGTLSSITATRNEYNNSFAGLEIARQNFDKGITGAQTEDVVALEAQVTQAEAGLSLARANLARTLIITPISGTINTLNLRQGDYANAFSSAAIVSNNNALEITTYVSTDDKENIRVGSKVFIDNKYKGVVTSISPGLDPVTKKIEVRIGVIDTETDLTNGSSVRISIDRNGFEIDPTEITELSIPISALKIETNRIIVFTVNADNELTAHEVETGLILGDSVRITSGLTPEMTIVKDARGLREGQEVVLNTED